MNVIQHHVNNRVLTAFSPLAEELTFEPDRNYLFDLSYLGMLDVQGEQASQFLQGQLSCDLRQVSEKQMRPGALCNLKGRVLALVDVVQWHGFRLILPTDLLKNTQASLAKTAMFSKVILHPSQSYQFIGFYFQNPKDWLPFNVNLASEPFTMFNEKTYCGYHRGNHFYILMVPSKQKSALSTTFSQLGQWRGSLAWHACQLQHRQIEIYPESHGLFLPHRLGLHLSGRLSFDKGCYKGQEIIARMHYRGTLKHEMKCFTIQTNEPLQSGNKLLTDNGQVEIGELIDFCPIADNKFLLVTSIQLDHPKTCLIEGHQSCLILNPC